MPKSKVPVVRIVVHGRPYADGTKPNIKQARTMLMRAFADDGWPGRAMFAITPGGLVHARFPLRWDGQCGWESRPEDFQALIPYAREAVDQLLRPHLLDLARGRADYLTLGVDLTDMSGKGKMDRAARGLCAELVAVIDVERGVPVWWTGKSYPANSYHQENRLVQEVDLKSHLFKVKNERVLVLGCHDLNMFSARAWANMTTGSRRHRRSQEMWALAEKFRPTMILQHPHSTDSPRIWSTAWAGARELLPDNDYRRHVWASGIAYHYWGDPPRGTLDGVLQSTRCCDEHVVDIVVKP